MEEKVGFFKTVAGMFKGLVRPSEYIKTGRKSSWFAIHVLVICVSILLPMVVFYIPVSKKIGYNRLADAIDDRIAYFSVSQDGFYCKKKYEMKRPGGAYIRIDSTDYDTESDEIDELLEEGHYRTMVIVSNQEILLYSDDAPTRISWSSVYSHLRSIEKRDIYDKEILLTFTRRYDTPFLIGITLVMAVLLIFIYYIATLIWGFIINAIKRIFGISDEVSFSDIVKASTLVRTPWFAAAVLIAGYVLKGQFVFMYILCVIITFVYLIAAIKLYADQILRIPEKPETGAQEEHVPDEDYYGD